MATRFDPNKSRVKEGQMATFINGDVEEDIESVPGVGPAAAGLLAKKGVNNTYQLIGVYLGLRENGMSMQDHHDAFLNFIIKAGIKNYRHGIVLAIAEKVSAMIPGLFSPDALEEHK